MLGLAVAEIIFRVSWFSPPKYRQMLSNLKENKTKQNKIDRCVD